jgi:hypothetical protein
VLLQVILQVIITVICHVTYPTHDNILRVLLELETISFSTCGYILKVNVLFREPLSVFTIFHNTVQHMSCDSFYSTCPFLFNVAMNEIIIDMKRKEL